MKRGMTVRIMWHKALASIHMGAHELCTRTHTHMHAQMHRDNVNRSLEELSGFLSFQETLILQVISQRLTDTPLDSLMTGLWKVVYFYIQLITHQTSAELLAVTRVAYIHEKSRYKAHARSALLSYKLNFCYPQGKKMVLLNHFLRTRQQFYKHVYPQFQKYDNPNPWLREKLLDLACVSDAATVNEFPCKATRGLMHAPALLTQEGFSGRILGNAWTHSTNT